MRAWKLLVVIGLAGCGVPTYWEGEPATPPPPVPLADGTVVTQNWQFRTSCQENVAMELWTETNAAHGNLPPMAPRFMAMTCRIGESVCYAFWTSKKVWGGGPGHDDAGPQWCLPCSSGWLPMRDIACD